MIKDKAYTITLISTVTKYYTVASELSDHWNTNQCEQSKKDK